MCVERARVSQRGDDEHDGEEENRGGSRQRLRHWPPDSVLGITNMPSRSLNLFLTRRDYNNLLNLVVLSHSLFLYMAVLMLLCCVTPSLPFWVFELLMNGEDQKWKLWNGSVRCAPALQKKIEDQKDTLFMFLFVFVQYWLKKKKRENWVSTWYINII